MLVASWSSSSTEGYLVQNWRAMSGWWDSVNPMSVVHPAIPAWLLRGAVAESCRLAFQSPYYARVEWILHGAIKYILDQMLAVVGD